MRPVRESAQSRKGRALSVNSREHGEVQQREGGRQRR